MLKLGKAAPRYDKRSLYLSSYRKPQTPVNVPLTFGAKEASKVKNWGMLGNDQYGCCVFAGAAHETLLWASEAKHDISFNTGDVLADYGAVTGFNPDNPQSDQGTVVLDAMNYRRNTGILAADGTRHQICAFAQLEPGNFEQAIEACYRFGAIGVGIRVPSSAMDQYDAGETWSVVPGASIEGGHYVPMVGRRHNHLLFVTWGKVVEVTKRFYETYVDEAFAILDDEMLGTTGKSLQGFDLAALREDLLEIAPDAVG